MTTTRKNTSTHRLLSQPIRYHQQTLDRVVTTTEIRTLDLHFVGRTLRHCIIKVFLHMLPGPAVRMVYKNVVISVSAATPINFSEGTNAIIQAGWLGPQFRSGRRFTGQRFFNANLQIETAIIVKACHFSPEDHILFAFLLTTPHLAKNSA